MDEAPWPAQIDDTKTAIRWLRASADRLGVNPDAIALCGFSAGAHLALLAAGTADSDVLRDTGSHAHVSERVAAVVAFFPPVRLSSDQTQILGVSAEEGRVASPIEHVSSAFPPVLLLHGTGDTNVPYSDSVQMFDALAAAGAPVDLRLYAGLPHEFVRLPGFLDVCVTDIALFLDRFVVNSAAFNAPLAELRRFWQERARAPRPATTG